MTATDKTATRPPKIPARLDVYPEPGEQVDWYDNDFSALDVRGALLPALGDELHGLSFRASRLVEVNLVGATLAQFRLLDVELVRCDLSGGVWDSASLERVVFRDCRMTGLALSGAALTDVRIEGCGAELMSLRMAKARRLHVESSMLRGADWNEAALAQSRLVHSDLRGASFQRAQLQDVSLHGSKLDDIAGAGSLRGARVSPDQAIMLGGLLLAEAGIEVEDAHGLS
ncbi:pentapeptide repeat-containing protein [Segniliparus rugosus]|uniref:pentapeptide repeat-containing protein n=1 Tax=Segniliparus rugosus TaxID=286804 RepID=UPI0003066B52|nr:pentapeptide repeat-containing protein [Segniliparus rugosus]